MDWIQCKIWYSNSLIYYFTTNFKVTSVECQNKLLGYLSLHYVSSPSIYFIGSITKWSLLLCDLHFLRIPCILSCWQVDNGIPFVSSLRTCSGFPSIEDWLVYHKLINQVWKYIIQLQIKTNEPNPKDEVLNDKVITLLGMICLIIIVFLFFVSYISYINMGN